MRAVLLVLGFLAAASCASAEVRISAFTPAMTKNAVAAAKAVRGQFNREMLDYPSARFRDVRAIQAPIGASILFCGYVNGKNRMGAFSGWKEFAAVGADDPSVNVRPADDIMVDAMCSGGSGTQDTRDYSADLIHR
jgi:hypothetical protein